MGSLSYRPKTCVLVALDHRRRDHSLPPASPASKRSSLRESVRADPSCPEPPVVALLGFAFPFRDQTLLALEPSTRQARRLSSTRRPWTPARDAEDRVDLLRQVKPRLKFRRKLASTSSAGPDPRRSRTVPPLGDIPSPLTFQPVSPPAPASGALQS
jgi:hypothetical protein